MRSEQGFESKKHTNGEGGGGGKGQRQRATRAWVALSDRTEGAPCQRSSGPRASWPGHNGPEPLFFFFFLLARPGKIPGTCGLDFSIRTPTVRLRIQHVQYMLPSHPGVNFNIARASSVLLLNEYILGRCNGPILWRANGTQNEARRPSLCHRETGGTTRTNIQ